MKFILLMSLATSCVFCEFDVNKYFEPDVYSNYLKDMMKKTEESKSRYEEKSDLHWFILGQQWAYQEALRNYWEMRSGNEIRP